jgi:Uncharacterized protein conserved in bacteria (DUF2225)
MHSLTRFVSILLLLSLTANSAFATTWFPKDFNCPVDNEKNTFLVIGSYGSYIYSWESKYQWLFFPQTDSPTFYLCKKCHLATYMWDFDKLPKDKISEIQKALASVKVSETFKTYTEIPVTERLEIMAKVYPILQKTESWWESFYRVQGYHYAQEGNATKALEARKKSLELLTKFLKDEKTEDSKKLLLYTSAAMKHFTMDDKGALEDLQKALETKYVEKDLKPEELKNAEDGLNQRIKDYIERIKSNKKPRSTEKES